MQVDPIADQLSGDRLIFDDRRQGSGLSMVQAGHGIEKVRNMVDARSESYPGFVVGGGGVSESRDDAAGSQLVDQLQVAGQFGSDGHHCQLAAAKVDDLG